ncbi:hypothetical protein L3X38_034425 [Prunus dulcis]|uniref:Uncharacterized protein n=1 Tax=Prunus dulcis TaxID=3755 RepID=A0AAD4VK20_PRUDU|nr:hypothetical protein L3X38_034425 [Prunus dulcis]
MWRRDCRSAEKLEIGDERQVRRADKTTRLSRHTHGLMTNIQILCWSGILWATFWNTRRSDCYPSISSSRWWSGDSRGNWPNQRQSMWLGGREWTEDKVLTQNQESL